MAKKIIKETEGKEFSFDELDKYLSTIDPKGSRIDINNYSKITEWINSGNYLLNAQLSGSIKGGYANARAYILAGENSVGKSFLALNACRNAQKQGYQIIYMDSEAAMDIETVKKFGLDPAGVRYQPVLTTKQVRHFVINLCEKIKSLKEKGIETPKLMLVLDSLGNLATEKERGDAISGSDKKDMTKQQELRSLFRVITMDLAELKIPLICTTHVYSSVGSFIGGNEISGGGGAKYVGSVMIELTKAQLKEDIDGDDTKKTGIIVTSNIKKNRFAKPHKIKFHISFYRGMNPYVGLEEFISWDSCGIQRGKLLSENEFNKLYGDKDTKEANYIRSTRFEFLDTETNKTKILYFEPKETARGFAVKHLGECISPKELFSSKVFTNEVLDILDEKVIKPYFSLPNINDDEEFDVLLDSIANENQENEIII